MKETLVGADADKYEKMSDILSMVCTFRAHRVYLHPDREFFGDIPELGKEFRGMIYMLDHHYLNVRCWSLRDKDAAKLLLEDILEQFLNDDYEWNDKEWTAKSGNHTIAYGMGEPPNGFIVDLQHLFDLWEPGNGT